MREDKATPATTTAAWRWAHALASACLTNVQNSCPSATYSPTSTSMLTFDHLPPSIKKTSIITMMQYSSLSIDLFKIVFIHFHLIEA